MNRKFVYLAPAVLAAGLLALTCSSCHSARTRKTNAEAERIEADADLKRAQAGKLRYGGNDQPGYVEVQVAPTPPPPTPEQMSPSPGSTYVWVPGYQSWNNGSWVWTPGHWSIPPQPAATWVPAHWERSGQGWLWVEGAWR